MKKPPHDDDDALYEELLDQVREALAALDVEPGDLAESVVDGLRGALDGVAGRMRVLDGGEEPSDVPPPHLEIAEEPRVRVVKVDRPRVHVQEAPLHLEGALLVAAGATQTLFRGSEARIYRIHCSSGAIEVHSDGAVDRVGPGQSVDVEAVLVRIRGIEASEGRYARVG